MTPTNYYISMTLCSLAIFFYFYTILCNPGRIQKSEDNSFENGKDLEVFGYTYCTYCQLYRPPHAYHCSTCNCCYLEYNLSLSFYSSRQDHHCMMMGYLSSSLCIPLSSQCVAKYNYYSFYGFLVCAIACIAFVEYQGVRSALKQPIRTVLPFLLSGNWIGLLSFK